MNSWERLLQTVEKKVNRHSFRTWFRPTRLVEESDGDLTVAVPNELFREWITSNYQPILNEAIAEHAPGVRAVAFTCPPAAATDGRSDPMARRGRAPANGAAASHLSSRYSFDTFVVSSCNQFAHAAARRVAEHPSTSYNPLYIYGGVGLGKTHLLHAIGQHNASSQPGAQLRYVSTENFMNELINAIRFERTHEFKARYRSVDVLLVDDIQFLEGKERTQEEFFHTFNQLHECQKQIVISSDCPPREIPTLEERLRSRFEWGLIADIQPPDLETKVAILRKKAEFENVELPQEVALYIASKVRSNIRELEGCLLRVSAYARLAGRPLDLEMATETLKGIMPDASRGPTVESIQKFVADFYKIRVGELRTRNNAQEVALPRHVAMYLSKELTGCSLPEIGRRFGNKHHSTVLHAIRKIVRLREGNADFDRQVSGLRESLQ